MKKLEQLCLARRLKVQRIAVQQLTPELAGNIADAEVSDVVFVDTRITTGGSLKQKVQIQKVTPGDASPDLGHHLDPFVLMLYAKRLFDKQPRAWKVSVPGLDFGHGEGLSETARQAIIEVSESFDGTMPGLSCRVCRQ